VPVTSRSVLNYVAGISNGQTIAPNGSYTNYVLNAGSTIAAATISLPDASTMPATCELLVQLYNGAVTTITFNQPASGGVLGAPASLAAGTTIGFMPITAGISGTPWVRSR
jgi:hypothetical protein